MPGYQVIVDSYTAAQIAAGDANGLPAGVMLRASDTGALHQLVGGSPVRLADEALVQATVAGGATVPDWAASKLYAANAIVRATVADTATGVEVGDLLRRTSTGTSRASFDATEAALWTELGPQIVKSVASIAPNAAGNIALSASSVGAEPTITTLPLTKGGTGGTTAALARTSLGLGGAATLNVGTAVSTVAAGDDSRMSDARTPTAHTHAQADVTGLVADLTAKQPTLVSGTNIRTVGGISIVGGGNVPVQSDSFPTVLGKNNGTGGTITTPADDPNATVHTFTSPGNLVVPNDISAVQVLLVAGGGGGGGGETNSFGGAGGGGGAGQVLAISSFAVTPGATIPVVIGAGGVGGTANTADSSTNGAVGASSTFSTLTAVGGGAGGGDANTGGSRTGASGGGGAGDLNFTGGTGTAGFSGGTGGSGRAGAGGGGASEIGENAGVDGARTGGDGGAGVASSISGASVVYGGGGGGAANSNGTTATGGAAGAGGGGTGDTSTNGTTGAGSGGTVGTANMGGGGGGGCGRNGFTGGSGVVIIRYVPGLVPTSVGREFNDDTLAAAGGIALGGLYRTGSVVKVRAA